MVNSRVAGRQRRGVQVGGRGRLRNVSLSGSVCRVLLLTVIEDDGNRANVKGEAVASTDANNLQAMPSGSQPVLAQESLVGELQTIIPIAVHHPLYKGLQLLTGKSVGENSRNEEVERVRGKQDRLVEHVDAYNMEKKNLQKTLLKRGIAMKVMAGSVVDLKRIMNRLEPEKSLLMEMKKDLVSCSSQTTLSGGQITKGMLKYIFPVYL